MPEYQERYVAFVDILGFSNLVEKSNSDPELLQRLVSVLEEVQMYNPLANAMDNTANDDQEFFKEMFRMSTFSDSVLISTKANAIGLGLITTLTAIMCNRLLHQGIMTRGGISKGNMIHTDKIVVGEGLIKAYKLESSTAIYPRVILDEIILGDLQAMESQGGSLNLRLKDRDGIWFLHILEPQLIKAGSATSTSEYENLNNSYMAMGKKEIENSLKETSTLGVKAKLTWLANYFNEHAENMELPQISLE